jgi:plasmid stability protein
VRNVPTSLYERLKQRAEAQRRSLSAEVVMLLEWALEQSEYDSAAALQAIRERRSAYVVPEDAPDSVTLLREDRAR